MQLAAGQVGEAITGEPSSVQPLTRFQNRNFADRILGPSAGLMVDVPLAISGMVNPLIGNGFTQSEINAQIRLAPYSNFLVLGDLLKIGKRKAYENLGIPKTRSPKKKSVVFTE